MLPAASPATATAAAAGALVGFVDPDVPPVQLLAVHLGHGPVRRVVVGELDTLKPPSYSRLIAKRIPGAQMMLLSDAGHACCLETPHTWNAALLGFLAELETRTEQK